MLLPEGEVGYTLVATQQRPENTMNLSRKIVLVLIAGITLYTAVGLSFNRLFILPSFHQLEVEEARKDMLRCLAALDGHITQIELLCNDWSAWDDTYAFVEKPNDAYIEANLYKAWFVDNDMNLMYFFRSDGTIAWGQFFDLKTGAPAPFPEFSEHDWRPDDPILYHTNRNSIVRGVISTSKGPMLLVSRPILPSEASAGEVVRGALVMGRLLDENIVRSIRDQTQVAVDIIDLDHQSLPVEASGLEANEIRVVDDSPEVLRVLTHTHDLMGRDLLAFEATIPRLIMARGQSAIQLNMLAAGIAGFVFLLMLLAAMKWLVSTPLQRLSGHVKGIGLSRGMAPAPLAERQDEIGEMAREFNYMLERLQSEEKELIATEAALRASQARTRTILETAPDTIVIIDMEGKIESVNRAAMELFGREIEKLPGSPAAELIAPESHDLWNKTLRAARGADHGAVEAEMSGLGPRGETVPIHVSVSTTELEGTRYYTCAMRDISALKAMQEKIARNQHLARIGEMGATVAHEIRNPLAGMKGALQIIAGGTLDEEEYGRILGEVQGLIDRISGTVEQLLRYAKPIKPQMEQFLLRNMVESVCHGNTPRPPEGVEVVLECSDSLLVQGDSRLLRQVLENIWANACQAVRSPGRIVWRGCQKSDMIEIQLQNDGPPIREADLVHVFEPFFTTRVEGSGLGLAVSHRIVEAHEGRVYIENCGETGVNVVIQLPQGE